jgi:hypothetical protein
MVIFNDPVPVENPALQAVLMALDTRTAPNAIWGQGVEIWGQCSATSGHQIGQSALCVCLNACVSPMSVIVIEKKPAKGTWTSLATQGRLWRPMHPFEVEGLLGAAGAKGGHSDH